MLRAVLLSLSLVACGTSVVSAPIAQKTSALTLSSAVVAVPSATTLSCHGGAICREHVVAQGHDDVIEDATADCTRRGGTIEREPCRRDGRLGSCVVGGEAGPITVLLYGATGEQRDALESMSAICEELDGSLELASR